MSGERPASRGNPNIAFGRGRGFARKDMYLANYGSPLGSGTQILRVGYNHAGARLR